MNFNLSWILVFIAIIANFIATALLGVSAYALWKVPVRTTLDTTMVWTNIGFAVVHALLGVAGLFGLFRM